MLAVVGNIITAWSFFGTNILGVGLHAYGGDPEELITKARSMMYFMYSQLAFVVLGAITYFLTRRNSDAISDKARTA
jgi:hypothetical protein